MPNMWYGAKTGAPSTSTDTWPPSPPRTKSCPPRSLTLVTPAAACRLRKDVGLADRRHGLDLGLRHAHRAHDHFSVEHRPVQLAGRHPALGGHGKRREGHGGALEPELDDGAVLGNLHKGVQVGVAQPGGQDAHRSDRLRRGGQPTVVGDAGCVVVGEGEQHAAHRLPRRAIDGADHPGPRRGDLGAARVGLCRDGRPEPDRDRRYEGCVGRHDVCPLPAEVHGDAPQVDHASPGRVAEHLSAKVLVPDPSRSRRRRRRSSRRRASATPAGCWAESCRGCASR